MKEYLYTMLRSLNALEIKGKDNMEVLLGCIMATERMISVIEAETKEEVEEEEEGE